MGKVCGLKRQLSLRPANQQPWGWGKETTET